MNHLEDAQLRCWHIFHPLEMKLRLCPHLTNLIAKKLFNVSANLNTYLPIVLFIPVKYFTSWQAFWERYTANLLHSYPPF